MRERVACARADGRVVPVDEVRPGVYRCSGCGARVPRLVLTAGADDALARRAQR